MLILREIKSERPFSQSLTASQPFVFCLDVAAFNYFQGSLNDWYFSR